MANHPYNVGDEVLIRGTVTDTPSSGGDWIVVEPSTLADSGLDGTFEVHHSSITQSTPTEPGDKSVLLDRHGFSWQRISGEWCQGDVSHQWSYLLEHNGPVKIIHREGDNG